MKKLISLIRDEKGATAIEYGLIAGLIAVVIVSAVGFIGQDLQEYFDSIESSLGGDDG